MKNGYAPGPCRCVVQAVEVPASVPCNTPWAMRVKVQNTSVKSWQLRPGTNAGVHAGYIIYDAQGHQLTTGRSGLFDAEVAPAASIDVTLVLPPLTPGTYNVLVDMVDEQQCWFFQTGSEPLEREVRVEDRGSRIEDRR